jgi:hypothetical protein
MPMHEIYMLAVLFNASQRRTAERTPDERRRDEQAFYDLYSGDRPRFKRYAKVPVALVTFAAAMGLTHLLLH